MGKLGFYQWMVVFMEGQEWLLVYQRTRRVGITLDRELLFVPSFFFFSREGMHTRRHDWLADAVYEIPPDSWNTLVLFGLVVLFDTITQRILKLLLKLTVRKPPLSSLSRFKEKQGKLEFPPFPPSLLNPRILFILIEEHVRLF
jgi:hypothetical protein